MVRLQFQENTKMLTVPTNNIFDQKYFRNISSWFDYNFKRILKCSQFLQTTFLSKNTLET